MTLREALIMAVESLRENHPDCKRSKGAALVLERKAERLREKREASAGRKRELMSVAFSDRELSMDRMDIYNAFRSTHCVCGSSKPAKTGVCNGCWKSLSAVTRAGMGALRMGDGWEQAYESALSELGFHPLSTTQPTHEPTHV